MISYNYDCPGTNQIALNLFTPNKSVKLVLGLRSVDLSRGTASLFRGEWFREVYCGRTYFHGPSVHPFCQFLVGVVLSRFRELSFVPLLIAERKAENRQNVMTKAAMVATLSLFLSKNYPFTRTLAYRIPTHSSRFSGHRLAGRTSRSFCAMSSDGSNGEPFIPPPKTFSSSSAVRDVSCVHGPMRNRRARAPEFPISFLFVRSKLMFQGFGNDGHGQSATKAAGKPLFIYRFDLP